MEKGKKTMAVVAVIMICAVAMAGVAYAAFSAQITTDDHTAKVKMLTVSEDNDSVPLGITLGFKQIVVAGEATYEFDKDASSVSAGPTKLTLENKTGEAYSIEKLDVSKMVTAHVGVVSDPIPGWEGRNALPVSMLNGIKFTLTFTEDVTGTPKTATLTGLSFDENGKTVGTGVWTGDLKSMDDKGKVKVSIAYDSTDWNPVIKASMNNYNNSTFELTFDFTQYTGKIVKIVDGTKTVVLNKANLETSLTLTTVITDTTYTISVKNVPATGAVTLYTYTFTGVAASGVHYLVENDGGGAASAGEITTAGDTNVSITNDANFTITLTKNA